MSSKVSKDLNCSLVSSKNFSKILPPNGWHPGPGKVGQGGLKALHLLHHSQKTRNSQAKNFFSSADQKTSRVFWDFYRVCRAYRTGEIPAQSHMRLGIFFRKSPKAAGRQRVNKYSRGHSLDWGKCVGVCMDKSPVRDGLTQVGYR